MRKFNFLLKTALFALSFVLFSFIGLQGISAQNGPSDEVIDYSVFTTFEIMEEYTSEKINDINSGQTNFSEPEMNVRLYFYKELGRIHNVSNPSEAFENAVAATMRYNKNFRNPIDIEPIIQETLDDIQE